MQKNSKAIRNMKKVTGISLILVSQKLFPYQVQEYSIIKDLQSRYQQTTGNGIQTAACRDMIF
jgi:hypothetical protein